MDEVLLTGTMDIPHLNQILLIDKEAGWTSFDVVAKIRGTLNTKYSNDERPMTKDTRKRLRVGHAGTLDPFATGLLIVLVGDATKKQDSFMKLDKEYLATLRLGHISTTGDPEGTIEEIAKSKYQIPNRGEITEVLKKFTGQIEQMPSAYSAIKIDGQRAYKLAREGKEVAMKSRKISIHKLRIVSYEWPELKIMAKCSSGTYIRTLGEDIGKSLDCGAYLTELRRIKIGSYKIEDAHSIDFYTKV